MPAVRRTARRTGRRTSRRHAPYMPVLGRQPGTQVFRSIDEYPDSETYPGLLVMDFDAGLFFASADGLVRRRLIQKMEKLSLHLSWTEPPTPEELVAYYAANSE